VGHAAAIADVTVAILRALRNATVEACDNFAQAVEVVVGILDLLARRAWRPGSGAGLDFDAIAVGIAFR